MTQSGSSVPNPVSWSFGVDTRSQVPTDGNFQIDAQRHERGRGDRHRHVESVSVDNDPVGVSFRTPNDAEPEPLGQPRGHGRRYCPAPGLRGSAG